MGSSKYLAQDLMIHHRYYYHQYSPVLTISFMRTGAIVLFTAISPSPNTAPLQHMCLLNEWIVCFYFLSSPLAGSPSFLSTLIKPRPCQEPQSTQTLLIIFSMLFHHSPPASQTRNLDFPQFFPHFLRPGHSGVHSVQPFPFLNISTLCSSISYYMLGCRVVQALLIYSF